MQQVRGPIRLCMHAAVRHMWYDQALGGYDYSCTVFTLACMHMAMHVHRECVRRWRVGAPGPCMRGGLSERHTRFPSCSMTMLTSTSYHSKHRCGSVGVRPLFGYLFLAWSAVYATRWYGVSLEPSYKVCICSTCGVLCTSVKRVRLLY
jgi:hypothetical protein